MERIKNSINNRLIEIISRHCKLALKALDFKTTVSERNDIQLEIESLREERDILLELLRNID